MRVGETNTARFLLHFLLIYSAFLSPFKFTLADTTTLANTVDDKTAAIADATATKESSASVASSSSLASASASASKDKTKHTNSNPGSSKYIKTSSLLTCMLNSQLTSNYFDVYFFPDNNTITFNIDATTTINQKVMIQAELITYGLKVLERTIDPCSLKIDALCPLSPGRIDIQSQYQLDTDITDQIPVIAYSIPDLDAQVRVIAYAANDTAFTTPLACVQAILSNGKTVQTKYASWPIAAVSGIGVLTSGFVSVIGYSATAAHIASNSISLFVYFQNLAITAMMGVSRVPPIAAAWTQNFQWSMGIINVGFMQKILNWYVQATKGVSSVVVANKNVLSISVQKRKRDLAEFLAKRGVSVASSSDFNFDKILDESHLYTTNERNSSDYANKILVLRGIQRVSYLANIEISNFFLTGIVFFLAFLFAVVICMIFFKSLLEVLTRARVMSESNNFFQYRKHWGSIIKGTLFRLSIIALPQVSLLAIWEFTQVNSPAILVDAIVIFVILTGLLLYGTIKVLVKGKESQRLYKNTAYLLYGDTNFLNRFGFLYVQFKADTFWWLLPLLAYSLLRSLFVAVLQEQGKPQAVIIFIIELVYFVALCCTKPYLDKRTNIFNIVIHLINLINSIFFLFFSNIFRQPAVVSSIMAIVLFVLNAVFALFLLIFTIVTCTLALVHKNPDVRYQPVKDDRLAFIPKVQNNSMVNLNNDKSEIELFELRQAVMDTNETHEERVQRENRFISSSDKKQNVYETVESADKSSLFDSGTSYSGGNNNSNNSNSNNNINYNRNSNGSVMRNGEIDPSLAVQALSPLNDNSMSAVFRNSDALRIGGSRTSVRASNANLRRPDSSFYTGPNYSYSRDFL